MPVASLAGAFLVGTEGGGDQSHNALVDRAMWRVQINRNLAAAEARQLGSRSPLFELIKANKDEKGSRQRGN